MLSCPPTSVAVLLALLQPLVELLEQALDLGPVIDLHLVLQDDEGATATLSGDSFQASAGATLHAHFPHVHHPGMGWQPVQQTEHITLLNGFGVSSVHMQQGTGMLDNQSVFLQQHLTTSWLASLLYLACSMAL